MNVVIHLLVRTSALFTDTKTSPLAESLLVTEATGIHSLIKRKHSV